MHSWIILVLIQYAYTKEVSLNINFKEVASEVEREFLSLTFDATYFYTKSRLVDLKSEKLLALAQGLSSEGEFYLRFGGTKEDFMNFRPNERYYDKDDFDTLLNFVNKAKWRLIFGLNVLNRNPDGTWDPSNANELLEYIVHKDYNSNFELSNEFDLYPAHFNITLKPEQLAKDFKTLREMLNQVLKKKQVKLLGPDVATLERYNYFQLFLESIEEGILDGVTFHHYYSSSDHISPKNFTNVNYLDTFIDYGLKAISIVEKAISGRFKVPQVWIGETSSTYGGGSKGAGSSFAAGFLWLDKLGLAAQMGISVVLRQSFKGGEYSLVDDDFNPAPDYWSSLLHKRLIGQKVLNVTGYLEHGRKVRVYAHCGNERQGLNPSGSVALIVINVNVKEEVTLNFKDNKFLVDQYLLTPANGNIDDGMVALNGNVLKMVNETKLPVLEPIRSEFPLHIPPLSYGFFVLINSDAKVCK